MEKILILLLFYQDALFHNSLTNSENLCYFWGFNY